MLIKTTLFACAACRLHVRRTDLRCPHCDAPMRTAQGAVPQTRTALAMGLSFLAIASASSACTKIDDQRGDGGAGGEGGATPTTSSSTPTKSTGTTSTSSMQTATDTNSIAAYGVGPSMTCDQIGECMGGGSPDLGCFDCAVLGGGQAIDSGYCSDNYLACLGPSGDCSDGEPQCCQLDACLQACPTDPAAYWPCACGSADEAGCIVTDAPAGSCFGDNPTGADLMYGPRGWVTCVEQTCVTSCE